MHVRTRPGNVLAALWSAVRPGAAPHAMLLCAVALGLLVGCSDAATSDKDTTSVADGAGNDAQANDAVDGAGSATTTDVAAAVDLFACPGGYGCDCKADADCDTGLCLAGVGQDGASACATACTNSCPEGQRCRPLAGKSDVLWVCVDGRASLCDPCSSSKQCKVFGLADSACVDYGAKGDFCAVSCQGDADCGEGYRCTEAAAVEGETRLFCVKTADVGEPFYAFGTCGCSAAASDAKLATTCYNEASANGKVIGRCNGSRSCGADGLSACDAATPKVEACNGVDDDCDGLTDEATCEDGNPCTDDACEGTKGCSNKPNTNACDADGSNCTVGDACDGGTCKAGAKTDCDDGNACTADTCDKLVGCKHSPADGTTCDDGAPCTSGDACKAGACAAGAAKTCDDGKPCTLDSCDPTTGTCSNTLTKGLVCDDGKVCTWTDLCDASGACAGSAAACNDGLPCTVDSCDEAKGCVATQSPDGAGCDDGNACTGTGTCSGGTCLPGVAKTCPVDGPCFVASCFAATGACLQTQRKAGLACDDGDACTTKTTCDASAKCSGDTISCDDGDPCTTDACNAKTGCSHVAAADGSSCEDGDACTGPDTCIGGACKAGGDICQCTKDADCDDSNACTTDSCDVAKSTCNHTGLSGGCDDGDACTVGDTCGNDSGKPACLPGNVTSCDDGNACTDDSCDKAKGCVFAAKTDGTSCTDGDSCTQGDVCASGSCKPGKDTCACGKDLDCDDGNACTSTPCDTKLGKCATPSNLPDGATCTDGDACTGTDGCSGGACKAGAKVDCDDGDPCTADSCSSTIGCSHDPAQDGTACDDGDACTSNDVCASGSCKGTGIEATASIWAGSQPGYTDAKGELASFIAPSGLARTSDGILYVADIGGHRIRKIAADQTVTTVAGDGIKGQLDDIGTAARFRGPAALAIDGAGDLWVVDRLSHLVRKVTIASAAVTTIAGSNTPGGGVGADPVGGFADGKGTAAKFQAPAGIVLGSAGMIVADAGNHRLRLVAADGTVTTLAGSGTKGADDGPLLDATFAQPSGLAVAGTTIYVADYEGRRIRRLASGVVTTIAGDGTEGNDDGKGTAARFTAPWGLWVDGLGGLMVADHGAHRIRRVALDGTVSTYAGSSAGNQDGKLGLATFDGPSGLIDDGKGKLWIATQTGNRVRLIDDGAKACAVNQQP